MRKSFTILLLYIVCAASVKAQWTRLTDTYPTSLLLNDIYENGQKITAAGYDYSNYQNYIFQSLNGGSTWDTLQPVYAGYLFLTTAFKDPDTGFVAGFSNHTIWMRTVNGGTTWDYYDYDSLHGGISDMVFLDSEHGFAGGYGDTQFNSGHCYYTQNGGNTWLNSNDTSVPSPLDSFGLDYIDFLDVQTGYALSNTGSANVLMKTIDTGKHWTHINTNNVLLEGMYFWNVDNGMITDVFGRIYKTTNGGQSWTQLTSPVFSELISISFADDSTGYCVGVLGKILKTTNGGNTWTLETSSTTESLLRVKFFNGRAYATGNGGTVLRSSPVTKVTALSLAEKLNIYPNPAASVLNISANLTHPYKKITASLVDINGKVVLSGTSDKQLIQLQVADIAAGTYIVNIQADDISYRDKVTIVH